MLNCLNMKHFVLFITFLTVLSCRQDPSLLVKIDGKQLPVSPELPEMDSIESFITPYRNRVNEVLDSTLAYAPFLIGKNDGTYNTSEGNLLADILMQQANPIFKIRTGNQIDIALLNYGGIRSIINPGKITARTAYEIMPFENSIVVVELKGKSVRDMVSYLINADRPQPISGMQIILAKNGELKSVSIQGKPFDENRSYFVATIDYLLQGGGNMLFLKDGLSVTELDYLLRNAMIDYFNKVDTLKASVDDRFIKLEYP